MASDVVVTCDIVMPLIRRVELWIELKLVVGDIAVSFGGSIDGTKLDSGLNISSSELWECFIKSEVELLSARFVVDRNGGDMEDDAENGS